jgi:hypothetical protein
VAKKVKLAAAEGEGLVGPEMVGFGGESSVYRKPALEHLEVSPFFVVVAWKVVALLSATETGIAKVPASAGPVATDGPEQSIVA